MSIFVDENTKVVYQGLTGSQGRYYGLLEPGLRHGSWPAPAPRRPAPTWTASRSSPPVADAVAETGANASCIFIPAPGVRSAVMEAAEGGVEFIVCITEGVPMQDEAWFFNKLQRTSRRCSCWPELPRHHQPRQVQHRHHRRSHRQGAGRR